MNLQTWVLIIYIVALLLSYSVWEYAEIKENEKLKRNADKIFKTVIILNIIRTYFFNDNIQRNVFHIAIACTIILFIVLFIFFRLYRYNKCLSRECDEKYKEAANMSREEWEVIRFTVIGGIIFLAVMFGAYYLSHNVL